MRKLASDEIRDTLFFATGERVVKMKHPDHVLLSVPKFNVKIVSNKSITVNGVKHKSIVQAKWAIQSLLD
jgi:hypothetical protein